MGRVIYNLAFYLVVCDVVFGQASTATVDREWRSYGHDPGGMRFSPLKQINRGNVQQLQELGFMN